MSLRPPNGGGRDDCSIASPMKETAVPNPLTVVKSWAVEQATAIRSVTRPLPAQALPLR